jgi:hypothetical protein
MRSLEERDDMQRMLNSGQVGLAAVVRNEDAAGNSLQDARSALLAQCHVQRRYLIDLIDVSLMVL